MKIEYIDGTSLKKMFIGAANALEKNKELVNSLNVFPVPDGDTGTNMSLTMQSAIKQVKGINSEEIDQIATAASNGSLMGARGNSGVILSQLFRGFSKGLKGVEQINTNTLATAFKLGSDTAYKAVMKPIEGTILTVARECAEKAIEISKNEKDIISFLDKVIEHGERTLDRTPDMLPVLKQAGVVDAGGKGLLIILLGALGILKGETDIDIESSPSPTEDFKYDHDLNEEDITFGYCTEFIINNTGHSPESLRNQLSNHGDSILVVGGDDIIKVHIHTNNPGQVLENAIKLGELIDIKIDNMRYQHRTKVVEKEPSQTKEIIEEGSKKYSFISVAMGDGIRDVFRDLKVDHIIAGGQTMNPSTEDILNAIEEAKGENIIILPNNSNIILAATQAKDLTSKKVEVLPTKTIPQGISALLSFDEEVDLEENIESMKAALSSVKTGQVTFAVRDTVINDINISKDDIIGICDGDIKSVGKTVEEVSLDLIKNSVEDDNELITIFYGEETTEDDANELAEKIQEEFQDFDVEVVYGGQPLYYYIFSLE